MTLCQGEQPVHDKLTETEPGNNDLDLTFTLLSGPHGEPEVPRVHQCRPCKWALGQKAGWKRSGGEARKQMEYVRQKDCETSGAKLSTSSPHCIRTENTLGYEQTRSSPLPQKVPDSPTWPRVSKSFVFTKE